MLGVATRDDRPSFSSLPRISDPQPGPQEARGETALGRAIAAAGRRAAPPGACARTEALSLTVVALRVRLGLRGRMRQQRVGPAT